MWVTGLTDAEGSFIVSVYKRGSNGKWQVKPSFERWLESKDKATLDDLQNFFGVGIVNTREKRGVTSYTVTRHKDLLNVIIPHFNKYPLQSQKRVDFELFAQIVALIAQGEHLTDSGLLKILAIKSALK